MKFLRLSLLLFGTAALFTVPAEAQPWPSRPIRLVVPYAPGGSSDTLGRIIAQSLTAALGQQVTVENIPGAGGLFGLTQVARAEPDGYSLVVTGFGPLVVVPAMNPNIEYDPIRDLAHVGYLGGVPTSFLVNSSLGIRTLAELVERARRDREPIAVGTAGHGSLGQLVAMVFGRRAGVPIEHVPYKGSGQAVTDVVGGHLRLASINLATALGHIRAKKIVVLATSSRKRIAEMPDVPTFKELGYPELEVASWFAISGPAGMPVEIVQRLNREIVKAMQHPEMRLRLEREAIEVEPMSPEALTSFVKSEIALWAPIAKSVLEKR